MRFLLFFKTNSKIKLSDFTFDLCVYNTFVPALRNIYIFIHQYTW